MSTGIRGGLALLAAAVVLAACGSPSARPTASPSSTPSSTASTSPSASRTATTATVQPVPDADSIAQILLAIPVARRPSFLDPYGSAIHGARLGLGPSLRIAGYRSDPLFVCIQHVDMVAGTAGSWTAYAVTTHGVQRSEGVRGQCPTAPGRTQVLE